MALSDDEARAGRLPGELARLAAGQGPVPLVLDIGGEGRHPGAWNLNPSPVRTLAPGRGQPIPRHLAGRADAIPLPDRSVDKVIVERCPLSATALREIARVVRRPGTIVLRHAVPPGTDPHAAARGILPGQAADRLIWLGRRQLQETRFEVS